MAIEFVKENTNLVEKTPGVFIISEAGTDEFTGEPTEEKTLTIN